MRFNRKRHYVLKILSEKFINEELKLVGKRNVNADHFGLTYDEIEKLLKISPHKRELVLSELYKANEIVFLTLKSLDVLSIVKMECQLLLIKNTLIAIGKSC